MTIGSDVDHAFAASTRRVLLGQLADEGVPVIAAHLHGIGRFVRDGDAFAWEEDTTPVE